MTRSTRPARRPPLRAAPGNGWPALAPCCALILGLALAPASASDPAGASDPAAAERAQTAVVPHAPTETEAASPGAAPAVRVPDPSGSGVPAGAAGADTYADPAPAAASTPAGPSTTAPPAAAASRPAPTASVQAKDAAAARSLLPLVQPLWSELNESQRKVLAPLEPQWNTMSRDEKRPWLSLAARLPKMGAEDRARAEKRIREWAALTPEQRRLARDNYRLAKQLPKEQRVATWEQYQQMTPEQRDVLRKAGWTSNTAARHAGAPTGLAKEAAQPLWRRVFQWIWSPAKDDSGKSTEPVAGAAR